MPPSAEWSTTVSMWVPVTIRHSPREGSARRLGGEIPDATIARLPVYERVLASLAAQQVDIVSSERIAAASGVSSANVRRDLSYLGSQGTRGVGYHVTRLLSHVTHALGVESERPVVIVGAGHIGTALAAYQGLPARGLRVVGVVDINDERVGTCVAEGSPLKVRALAQLETVVRDSGALIGVIATPAVSAQSVCDRLVGSGVRSILNFAPVTLVVPQDVEIRQVDLAVELQILAFHEQRRTVTIPECSA